MIKVHWVRLGKVLHDAERKGREASHTLLLRERATYIVSRSISFLQQLR